MFVRATRRLFQAFRDIRDSLKSPALTILPDRNAAAEFGSVRTIYGSVVVD